MEGGSDVSLLKAKPSWVRLPASRPISVGIEVSWFPRTFRMARLGSEQISGGKDVRLWSPTSRCGGWS